MPRPTPALRNAYRHFGRFETRWRDNDVYGHMNNAVFYEYVDSAVNGWIIESGALEVPHGPIVGLVVASECQFHASLGFPDPVETGLRVDHLGTSSVRYAVGLFRGAEQSAAAEALFTHVYVASDTHRPVPLPDPFRGALSELC